MPNRRQPRNPSDQECQELIDLIDTEKTYDARDYADIEDLSIGEYVARAHIAVFDHFVSTADDYTGKVMVVVWSMGPECYEVDGPVMGPVKKNFFFWKEIASPRGKDRWSLDLPKLNRLELIKAGLSETNIYSFGLCTSCNPGLFYSFRREGRTGRMLSVIMIKA